MRVSLARMLLYPEEIKFLKGKSRFAMKKQHYSPLFTQRYTPPTRGEVAIKRCTRRALCLGNY